MDLIGGRGETTKASSIADLGEKLRHRRGLLKLTQSQAAGLSGVSHRLWSEVERGARPNVSMGTVLRMLQTMGLDLALLERGTLKVNRPGEDRPGAP